MKEITKILAQLGLNESEANVYLAMVQGSGSARDIIKVTRQKRPTVYYALNSLEKRGLISRTGLEGENSFAVESPERLEALVKQKSLEIEKLSSEVKELIPLLQGDKPARDKKPSVAFFEGVEAVKNVVMGSLYCKDRKINSIAPKDNFFWQVGKDFVEGYVEERVRNRIKTRNLWEEPIKTEIYKEYYENVSEVKILPEVMHKKFKTTIFIYDNKTLYISSIANSYAVLITSKEHHDTMEAIFEGLWAGSKNHLV